MGRSGGTWNRRTVVCCQGVAMHVDKTKLSGPVLLACLFEDGVQLQRASTSFNSLFRTDHLCSLSPTESLTVRNYEVPVFTSVLALDALATSLPVPVARPGKHGPVAA